MVAHSTSSGGPGLALAAEFDAPSREQWQAQVAKVLRRSGLIGDEAPPGPVEDVLASRTYDGIAVHPLYTGTEVEPGI